MTASPQPAPGTTPAHPIISVGPPSPRYIGLTTRAIAFALDAAVINLVALVVAAAASLILSVLHLPKGVRAVVVAAGAIVYVLWTIGYFVAFWSTTGQTPGGRAMCFKVVAAKGETLGPRRALLRCIGLLLAALPLFAGYLLILFDPRRRGLQDRLAHTVVVEAEQLSIAAEHRRRSRGLAADKDLRARSPHSDDDHRGSPPQAPVQRSH